MQSWTTIITEYTCNILLYTNSQLFKKLSISLNHQNQSFYRRGNPSLVGQYSTISGYQDQDSTGTYPSLHKLENSALWMSGKDIPLPFLNGNSGLNEVSVDFVLCCFFQKCTHVSSNFASLSASFQKSKHYKLIRSVLETELIGWQTGQLLPPSWGSHPGCIQQG